MLTCIRGRRTASFLRLLRKVTCAMARLHRLLARHILLVGLSKSHDKAMANLSSNGGICVGGEARTSKNVRAIVAPEIPSVMECAARKRTS